MQNSITQNRDWYIFDAEDLVLGRLSTEIADLLRGKKKISFRNNLDVGDFVVVINAEKIVLTGKKEEQKNYYHHTGYIGNLKTVSLSELREKHPEEIIKRAVSGMLPKNKLKKDFLQRLKVYAGKNHPHQNAKFVNEGK
jgi:large subunit ribosomal protein L13